MATAPGRAEDGVEAVVMTIDQGWVVPYRVLGQAG